MSSTYWIQEWAKVRQDEIVRIPENFTIHEVYLSQLAKEDFIRTFRDIWDLFHSIYGDIKEAPETFGMPLFKKEDYTEFTTQARESRKAAYRPFGLLYYLLLSGDLIEGGLSIEASAFKVRNDVKNTSILLERLQDYGFHLDGVKDYKIKESFILRYPDNENVLFLLKEMAKKAEKTDRLCDFFICHYKLFQDDRSTVSYGSGADRIADKMHSKEEQEFIYLMDKILKEKGYFAGERDWNEGPGHAYYEKESQRKTKGPYVFLLLSWKTELVLYLRIRNAAKCLDYLKECPDSVKQIFLWSDDGCINHKNGTCNKGQDYNIDGVTYWRCGCCNAPFHFQPKKEDIPHYLKLVELGLKK